MARKKEIANTFEWSKRRYDFFIRREDLSPKIIDIISTTNKNVNNTDVFYCYEIINEICSLLSTKNSISSFYFNDIKKIFRSYC
jgi:hypothetical protein